MKRKSLGLFLAFVLALLGTLLLVAYVQQARNQAVASDRLEPVLVVLKPVPKGTAAESVGPFVKLEQVPINAKAADGISSLAAVKGKKTSIDLVPGEQLLSTRFTAAAAADANVPEGKVEVTVTLAADRAMGGLLKQGDVVDLIGTLPKGESQDAGAAPPASTHIELTNVKITKIQTSQLAAPSKAQDAKAATVTDAPTLAPSGTFLVTLAVSPADAERVVYFAEFGRMWLTGEGAVPTPGIKIVTRENVQ
jgi:pilus assembly protein CpaB